MNILFLEQHPRFGGGSERICLSICTFMHRAGHATHLLHESDGDMVKAFSEVTSTTTRAKVRPIAVRKILEATRSLIELRRVIRAHNIEIVFTSQLGYVSLLAVSSKVVGIKGVVHIGLALSFGSPFYRWSQPRIAAAVTPSESMRLKCMDVGWSEPQLHVVANGVDTSRFRPAKDVRSLRESLGLPCDMPLIVYIGRLVEEKGIFTLIRAAGILKKQGAAFHLVMAGLEAHNERALLESLAKELGLGHDSFSIRESTPQPECLFAAADIAVVPSQWPEPFGLVAIEAMASGAVPIVSDAGILPEIIGSENESCVFRQGDAAHLAERIANILSNPTLMASIRASGYKIVNDRYELSRCGRSYERIFHDTLRSK